MLNAISLDALKTEVASIVAIAGELEGDVSGSAARHLRRHCEQLRPRLSGTFGNVGEQISRLATIARSFERSSCDRSEADAKLELALGRVQIALAAHEQSLSE